jgi:colanic acid/amylovoran biosynthesis glycosyltransferase
MAVSYRIVGAGDYSEAVYFCRHQLDLDECVTIVGALSPVEVRSELEWADVFLHAATSEGYCNAVMESQAMGVPVVCTDADGLAENVENGTTGFVVPRRDPKALAEKLHEIASNDELRLAMGRRGCERVQKHFRLSDQINAFEKFYQTVSKT